MPSCGDCHYRRGEMIRNSRGAPALVAGAPVFGSRCHRLPPGHDGEWPPVDMSGWCGEWAAEKQVPQPEALPDGHEVYSPGALGLTREQVRRLRENNPEFAACFKERGAGRRTTVHAAAARAWLKEHWPTDAAADYRARVKSKHQDMQRARMDALVEFLRTVDHPASPSACRRAIGLSAQAWARLSPLIDTDQRIVTEGHAQQRRLWVIQ